MSSKKQDSLKIYRVSVCVFERVRLRFVIAHSMTEAKLLILDDPLYKQYEIDVLIESITEVADFATATPKVLI